MTQFLTLRSVDQILEIIKSFSPLPAERVPLDLALGRVLAETFLAPAALPGFSRSTVDGFAVRARDVFGAGEGLPAALTLIGEIPMGLAPSLTIEAGQTVRVWTGGVLPAGADAVVMLEYARSDLTEVVELVKPLAPGENVILADEDAFIGQELIPKGQVIRPQEIALLAAFGQTNVVVRAQPKVAVIATGDEVRSWEAELALGQIRDANSLAVMALATAAGGTAKFYGLIQDDLAALSALTQKAAAESEVVVVSGGTSAGQKDFTLKALASVALAEILVHGAAISPGKPFILAKSGPKALLGLPGHPAGALVTAEIFLKALIHGLLGVVAPTWGGGIKARLSRPCPSAKGRRDYFRVKLENREGDLWARPILGKSGLITPLVGADALAICPDESEGLALGELAEIRLL
ncbi:MAG: molybdopterin molybdotransferase MoeA [Deltaproteobacteria bacterium]|jgi:molybdopterin molybdotransferase|nr:molybdopterin molybdotransferase MoeA [Deltaproteobacteria bacterium]